MNLQLNLGIKGKNIYKVKYYINNFSHHFIIEKLNYELSNNIGFYQDFNIEYFRPILYGLNDMYNSIPFYNNVNNIKTKYIFIENNTINMLNSNDVYNNIIATNIIINKLNLLENEKKLLI